jgi:DNA-binding MarR family transcriptional regulator
MLTPTEEGRTLYAELVAKASEVTRQTLAPLGSQEQDRLIKLLERLV